MKIIDTNIALPKSDSINIISKTNIIDKHKKYWTHSTVQIFLNNHKRERYSVDYYKNYKNEIINVLFEEYLKTNQNIIKKIPLLLNSHSFIDTDNLNQPRKLYTKLCEDNPKFSGKTLLEIILENNEENIENELKKSYNKEWLFDGDTIELTTINFYNSKLNDTIKELNLYN